MDLPQLAYRQSAEDAVYSANNAARNMTMEPADVITQCECNGAVYRAWRGQDLTQAPEAYRAAKKEYGGSFPLEDTLQKAIMKQKVIERSAPKYAVLRQRATCPAQLPPRRFH